MASASIFDPQSYNRYAYSFNNPLSFIDPTGLFSQDPIPAPHPTPLIELDPVEVDIKIYLPKEKKKSIWERVSNIGKIK
jgi:hypothetical protein